VAPFGTLIDTASLAARLSDHDMAIVDCRFDLADESAGEKAYAEAHIPGAVYAHLGRDLAGSKTGTNGRHPLPASEQLVATFGRLGIDARTQVVAYDQDTGMYASRLWWLLRWLGHDDVAVLDGGFAHWDAEGRPAEGGVATRIERHFNPHQRVGFTVTANQVGVLTRSRDDRIVDARAPERYRGEVEPIDPVAGHIPGAVNHFFQDNIENGRFRSPEALRAAFQETLGEVSPDRIVCYCGSGVSACHNILALHHAGMPGARLYPGSWSEWVAEPTRGVERSSHSSRTMA
jgi:thiosulfate/3-mercaptopyruvate sulfurtransferase